MLPQMPMAVPRFWGGKTTVIRESDWGIIIAPPIPWRTRAAISILTPEMPVWSPSHDEIPQRPEATVKIAMPSMKRRLRPKMSPRRPSESNRTA